MTVAWDDRLCPKAAIGLTRGRTAAIGQKRPLTEIVRKVCLQIRKRSLTTARRSPTSGLGHRVTKSERVSHFRFGIPNDVDHHPVRGAKMLWALPVLANLGNRLFLDVGIDGHVRGHEQLRLNLAGKVDRRVATRVVDVPGVAA
jgi:hypothetical protein